MSNRGLSTKGDGTLVVDGNEIDTDLLEDLSQGDAVADQAALTAADLTDNTAGTANTTLQALSDGSVYANDVAAIRNNFADLAAMVDNLTVDLTAERTKMNALPAELRQAGVIAT